MKTLIIALSLAFNVSAATLADLEANPKSTALGTVPALNFDATIPSASNNGCSAVTSLISKNPLTTAGTSLLGILTTAITTYFATSGAKGNSGSTAIAPSFRPTIAPSQIPTYIPTYLPSIEPSATPSELPTYIPSYLPSDAPSSIPSYIPSLTPSFAPSEQPSAWPSYIPSLFPTNTPTQTCNDLIAACQISLGISYNQEVSIIDLLKTYDFSASGVCQILLTAVRSNTCALTYAPTTSPTTSPTISPTLLPTIIPSAAPSMPTIQPTGKPTTFACSVQAQSCFSDLKACGILSGSYNYDTVVNYIKSSHNWEGAICPANPNGNDGNCVALLNC